MRASNERTQAHRRRADACDLDRTGQARRAVGPSFGSEPVVDHAEPSAVRVAEVVDAAWIGHEEAIDLVALGDEIAIRLERRVPHRVVVDRPRYHECNPHVRQGDPAIAATRRRRRS